MVAKHVTLWQKNPKFMRFLKEKPMSIQENWRILEKEMETENCILQGIQLEGIPDLIGFLLFHNFDKKDNCLEVWFRIDPEDQSKGICTQAVKMALHDILDRKDIETIIGWHSARNTGSFNVFKKSWFQIENFVPKQTFLPNINKVTDDFKRRINKTLAEMTDIINTNPIQAEIIRDGIKKHHLIL